MDLLGEVVLLADLVDGVQLPLQPVRGLFLPLENLFEHLAGAVVALLTARGDARVEPGEFRPPLRAISPILRARVVFFSNLLIFQIVIAIVPVDWRRVTGAVTGIGQAPGSGSRGG